MLKLSIPVVAILLAACSQTSADKTPEPSASMSYSITSYPKVEFINNPLAGDAKPRDVDESNALYEFQYAYPAAAGAIPALKSQLDSDIDRQKAELVDAAKAQQAEAKKNGFEYHALGRWIAWKVVTDLPGWLSLSQDIGSYEGGAHPNHGFASLVWDRQANRRRETLDLFISKEALSRAIRKDFCAALDRERAKKRGGENGGGVIPEFDQCIDPAESTIILGSSNRKAFDRIGVLIAPYEAGPYVEGDYEVTLPVTAAVLAAVKPEYRATFVAK